MVKRVTERTSSEKLKNIKAMLYDFILEGSGLEDQSVDYAVLFQYPACRKTGGTS